MSDEVKRPAYDARQRFYDVLMRRWERAGEYAGMGQLRLWYLELHGIYGQCAGWITSGEKTRIRDGCDEHWGLWGIRGKIDKVGSQPLRDAAGSSYQEKKKMEIEKNLLILQEELSMATQHMMLPTGEDEGPKELDVKTFMELSS